METNKNTANTGATDNKNTADTITIYFSRRGENPVDFNITYLNVGNTERLAHDIAKRLNTDIFKIEPVEPYSDKYDLTNERSRKEALNGEFPAIKPIVDITPYDNVILCYPIWHKSAPRVINTFIRECTGKFVGKHVYLVNTNDGSPGTAFLELRGMFPGAVVTDGEPREPKTEKNVG